MLSRVSRSLLHTSVNPYPTALSINTLIQTVLPRRMSQTTGNQAAESDSVRRTLWIRCVKSEDMLQGKFSYRFTEGSREKLINFNRKVSEPVGEALQRIKFNLMKKSVVKKSKKRKAAEQVLATSEDQENGINLTLHDQNGDEVDTMINNGQAWVQGGIFKLDNCEYSIEVNTPSIQNLTLPRVILAGFPANPNHTDEFTEASHCEYTWYRILSDNSSVLVGRDVLYTPTTDDVGYKLKLTIVPRCGERKGEKVEADSGSPVAEGPRLEAIEDRQKCTAHPSHAKSFRLMCYNILAEVYTDTQYSRDDLFAYCPNEYLDYDYRKLLIAKEILGYNSDIVCLQEVDKKNFNNYFQPLLSTYGYQSSMYAKQHQRLPANFSIQDYTATGVTHKNEEDISASTPRTESHDQSGDQSADPEVVTVSEGTAIFFKISKFRQIGEHSINISSSLENNPLFSDLMENIQNSAEVIEKILYRSGCSIQVLVLESIDDPTHRLCVATTHLYFHPRGSVVRLIQTAVITRLLQHVKSIYHTEPHKVSSLICGDFNCEPSGAAVQYILNRHIDKHDSIWSKDGDITMSGFDLRHEVLFDSACGFPRHTNYTLHFKECLDYLFYEKDHLYVESVVPLPKESQLLAEGGGIPSKYFPSDHLPLICELTWKSKVFT